MATRGRARRPTSGQRATRGVPEEALSPFPRRVLRPLAEEGGRALRAHDEREPPRVARQVRANPRARGGGRRRSPRRRLTRAAHARAAPREAIALGSGDASPRALRGRSVRGHRRGARRAHRCARSATAIEVGSSGRRREPVRCVLRFPVGVSPAPREPRVREASPSPPRVAPRRHGQGQARARGTDAPWRARPRPSRQ